MMVCESRVLFIIIIAFDLSTEFNTKDLPAVVCVILVLSKTSKFKPSELTTVSFKVSISSVQHNLS